MKKLICFALLMFAIGAAAADDSLSEDELRSLIVENFIRNLQQQLERENETESERREREREERKRRRHERATEFHEDPEISRLIRFLQLYTLGRPIEVEGLSFVQMYQDHVRVSGRIKNVSEEDFGSAVFADITFFDANKNTIATGTFLFRIYGRFPPGSVADIDHYQTVPSAHSVGVSFRIGNTKVGHRQAGKPGDFTEGLISTVQESLTLLGHEVEPDGVIGSSTLQAVRDFGHDAFDYDFLESLVTKLKAYKRPTEATVENQ